MSAASSGTTTLSSLGGSGASSHQHQHQHHATAGVGAGAGWASYPAPAPAPPQQQQPTTPAAASTTVITPHLPPSSPLPVAEARAALVATMANLVDTELQARASLLHANAAALARQERDVARATDGLRRETDKLAKVARDAGRNIKETGNVQNWAEVLERDFLVLEETLRLARGGDDDGDSEDRSHSGSDSWWSGSEAGSEVAKGPSSASVPGPSGTVDEDDDKKKNEHQQHDAGAATQVVPAIAAAAAVVAATGPAGPSLPPPQGSVGLADVVVAADADGDVAMMDALGSDVAPATTTTTTIATNTTDAAAAEPATPGGGGGGGVFARVDNALAASIREAMATSLDDARSETMVETPPREPSEASKGKEKEDVDAAAPTIPPLGHHDDLRRMDVDVSSLVAGSASSVPTKGRNDGPVDGAGGDESEGTGAAPASAPMAVAGG